MNPCRPAVKLLSSPSDAWALQRIWQYIESYSNLGRHDADYIAAVTGQSGSGTKPSTAVIKAARATIFPACHCTFTSPNCGTGSWRRGDTSIRETAEARPRSLQQLPACSHHMLGNLPDHLSTLPYLYSCCVFPAPNSFANLGISAPQQCLPHPRFNTLHRAHGRVEKQLESGLTLAFVSHRAGMSIRLFAE